MADAFLLREPDGPPRADHDRHREGPFRRASWLPWMQETGFTATSRLDPWRRDVFDGQKA